jgi:hypothetical protein
VDGELRRPGVDLVDEVRELGELGRAVGDIADDGEGEEKVGRRVEPPAPQRES